ncbi:MAG: hypothetical protein AVDCRST_MAG54-2901 [uncultured Actinomycetospora sp.]|uniref:Uncharacterized protein n=1 Tax=uncultured Actinomycetospora sp. TaxID=1135996 RepID=A0A6J4J324_9PSEU|nr:MAG: hypothetical protein AVDCRST_MAG54-2901 [uncultured Actinomycetospora sp.]
MLRPRLVGSQPGSRRQRRRLPGPGDGPTGSIRVHHRAARAETPVRATTSGRTRLDPASSHVPTDTLAAPPGHRPPMIAGSFGGPPTTRPGAVTGP